ncbi:MAG: glycosyltransferase family 39 protein [Planctomycetes bacterium]|nr:glycosyltransferase family 39 protein [Planctomycetota bacterium]
MSARQTVLKYAPIFFALGILSLFMRPPVPLDETRYLAVAWQMHIDGDWLVPHLNGNPYSQKPPLFFWLINAGWTVFGVNEWWPRLLPALATLLTLGLVARFASNLSAATSSERFRIRPEIAVALLVGSLAWVFFSTALLFDMLMALFTTMGWLGVLRAQRQLRGGWPLVAIAMGLGILCKGPVILLYILPLALFAPFFPLANPEQTQASKRSNSSKGKWYLQMLASLLLAACIALAWAIPAANHGGSAYADDILWGQTAGRIKDSFSHDHPWWWYLPISLALLLPWIFVPSFWRGTNRAWANPSTRWLLLSAALPFLIFSAMSGKQPHYLIPLMPLLAIAATSDTTVNSSTEAFSGVWKRMRWLMPSILLIALLIVPNSVLQPFRMQEMAQRVHALQEQNIAVLYTGKYHGDLHFLGRLTTSLHQSRDLSKLPNWLKKHGRGYLIVTDRQAERLSIITPELLEKAEFEQLYRTGKMYLIDLAHVELE